MFLEKSSETSRKLGLRDPDADCQCACLIERIHFACRSPIMTRSSSGEPPR
jgi:hypothetical protein